MLLIEELYEVKQYKLETLYLAVSLADRYMKELFSNGKESPCLLTLSLIALLMAAKIEEPIAPSVPLMIDLLNEKHQVLLNLKAVLKMEGDIIRTLDFSLRRVSQIQFLERYLRLFGLDKVKD